MNVEIAAVGYASFAMTLGGGQVYRLLAMIYRALQIAQLWP